MRRWPYELYIYIVMSAKKWSCYYSICSDMHWTKHKTPSEHTRTNINEYFLKGFKLKRKCVSGTNYVYLSPTICIVFSFQATGTASWRCSGACFSCELSVLVMCQLIKLVSLIPQNYKQKKQKQEQLLLQNLFSEVGSSLRGFICTLYAFSFLHYKSVYYLTWLLFYI